MAMPAALIRSAIEHYREDVEHHAFPSDAESYHLPESARRSLSPTLAPEAETETDDALVNQDAMQEWAS